MYLTLETDYAIRIVDCLARDGGLLGSKIIAERTCVTLRFSLKILRKLVASGIVCSYKGAMGGYQIARPLAQININDVLEAIEGPFILSRCLYTEFECTRTPDKQCPYHDLFSSVSDQVQESLKAANFADIIAGTPELTSSHCFLAKQ